VLVKAYDRLLWSDMEYTSVNLSIKKQFMSKCSDILEFMFIRILVIV
jgi:hypothetical protein